ncbi:relaxase/mobilization nuclease domain-containing protein [Arthrobacter sp. UYCu723]
MPTPWTGPSSFRHGSRQRPRLPLLPEPGRRKRPAHREQWGAIANDFMKDMDFTEDGGKAPSRRVAVRHGLSKNGNIHIHIAASMVRDDGTKWNSWKIKYKSQQVARTLEKKYGLNQLGDLRAGRGFTPAEQSKAIRQGLPEVERHSLARKVRMCAAATVDEAEFVLPRTPGGSAHTPPLRGRQRRCGAS